MIVFDLETTGLDRTRDQIIQFAALQIDTNNKIVNSLNLYIQPVGNYSLSLGAYFKHQITPEFLSDKPHFKDVAQKIVDFFENDDNILTYNGNNFDIPFLKNELNRYGFDIDFTKKKCYDAFLEEKRRNGINLENTYKRYKGKTMKDAGLSAHDAYSDIKATFAIFYAQQLSNPYGPEVMFGEDGTIQNMIFLENEKPCFSIGKYRGISVEYVAEHDQNYLKWCISDKCNFIQSTKNYLSKFIK